MGRWYYSDATGDMPDNYIGYLCPLDEGGETYDPYNFQGDFGTSFLLESHGQYNNGIVSMPDFFIHNGRMFCFYVAVTQDAELDGMAYCRLYATNSQDGGETWTLPQLLTRGMLHAYSEVVYPYTFDRIDPDGLIRGFFQLDSQPGTYVQGDESVYDDNFMNAFAVTLDEIDGIKDNSSIVNELPEMSIYPNPVTSTMNIYLEKEALIMVHNVLGHKIAEFTHDGLGSNSFNVSALESGVYIVTAKAGNASNSLKLVVQ